MIEFEFEGRKFRVKESELAQIGKEAEKEILDEETRQEIIGEMGMFNIAALNLQIPSCFACGSFEDYSGRCRYKSQVKATVNGETKGVCRRDDIITVYAIKSGKLDEHEV